MVNMASPKFRKVGDVGSLKEKMTVPVVAGDLAKTLEATSTGMESAEQELRRIVKQAQQENLGWATERLAELHKEPQFRFIDTMLVREDGRVLVNDGMSALYASLLSYAGYPKTQPPPNIGELLDMVLKKGILLYPLMARHSFWLFCRSQHLPTVLDIVEGNAEFFPYDEAAEFTFGFVPESVVPSETKKKGIALGDLGLWAISEKYVDEDKGSQDRIVSYKPRVYIRGDRHPAGRFIYITPNRKAATIASGHIPMDERTATIRVEFDYSQPDLVRSIFRGYEQDGSVNSVPLVLRHRPYTPWTGFFPKHGGSYTPPLQRTR